MAQYITDLKVSLNATEESELREQKYTKLQVNLNEGNSGDKIYLWYQKGLGKAVTRIQFSFYDSMTRGLSKAGYWKIDKNLNAGAGGNPIYLWFYRGSSPSDVPITDLEVTVNPVAEAEQYKAGWERLACDLNRYARGNWVYLFVKRAIPVYIRDIIASDTFEEDLENFKRGYIRVDEDTNRGAGGKYVFLWYLLTPDVTQAIRGPLQVSITEDEYENYQNQGYTPVNQDLNEDTKGTPVFLWYKKDGPQKPIRAISVIYTEAADEFVKRGIKVIKKNLNNGNSGAAEYFCFTESN